MNIGASQLIKSSLAQLVYLNYKKKNRKVTKRQYTGNKYAEIKAKGLAQELRGLISFKKFNLFFCIDAIKDKTGIEIKYVEDKYEDWYLYSSILQSIFYASLINKVKYLDTPKFRIREGYTQVFHDLKEKPITKFELWFGESDKYTIKKSKKVYDYYIHKAKLFAKLSEMDDFNEAIYLAKKYDSTHKFQDWTILKKDIYSNFKLK